jgi:hypothetical protein
MRFRNTAVKFGGKMLSKLRGKRGDSHIVAVVLIICVTIALCVVYQKQLYALFVNTVFPMLKSAAQSLTSYSGS